MSPSEAREALLFHAFRHPDVENERCATGFLGSLRPFTGLRERNFHEVMDALRVLAPTLQDGSVDRDVLACLVGICHLGRAWGVEENGMLRRNGLISVADVRRLDDWVSTISYATFCVLDGAIEAAFEGVDPRGTSPP